MNKRAAPSSHSPVEGTAADGLPSAKRPRQPHDTAGTIDTTPYVDYWPEFIERDQSLALYDRIVAECAWKQGTISIMGKSHNERRLTCVMGIRLGQYRY
jgi:hypothetical protein